MPVGVSYAHSSCSKMAGAEVKTPRRSPAQAESPLKTGGIVGTRVQVHPGRKAGAFRQRKARCTVQETSAPWLSEKGNSSELKKLRRTERVAHEEHGRGSSPKGSYAVSRGPKPRATNTVMVQRINIIWPSFERAGMVTVYADISPADRNRW